MFWILHVSLSALYTLRNFFIFLHRLLNNDCLDINNVSKSPMFLDIKGLDIYLTLFDNFTNINLTFLFCLWCVLYTRKHRLPFSKSAYSLLIYLINSCWSLGSLQASFFIKSSLCANYLFIIAAVLLGLFYYQINIILCKFWPFQNDQCSV